MAGKQTIQSHLESAAPPWSSLLVLPKGVVATTVVKAPPGFVLCTLQGKKCRTAANLFAECARALSFPDYFGHNWDALEECLADLEWLPAKGYVLLVMEAQAVLPENEDEYETLLEVLNDAGEAWSKGQTVSGQRAPFHILFVVSEPDKSARAHWRLEEFSGVVPATRTRAKTKRSSQRSARSAGKARARGRPKR